MLKIYGSPLCPDCVKCKEELEAAADTSVADMVLPPQH